MNVVTAQWKIEKVVVWGVTVHCFIPIGRQRVWQEQHKAMDFDCLFYHNLRFWRWYGGTFCWYQTCPLILLDGLVSSKDYLNIVSNQFHPAMLIFFSADDGDFVNINACPSGGNCSGVVQGSWQLLTLSSLATTKLRSEPHWECTECVWKTRSSNEALFPPLQGLSVEHVVCLTCRCTSTPWGIYVQPHTYCN